MLLLELILVLLGHRRHRRRASREALLRGRLSKARELRLELSLALRLQSCRLRLRSGEASELLLERSLAKASGLGSERAGLLLLLLLLRLLASHAE